MASRILYGGPASRSGDKRPPNTLPRPSAGRKISSGSSSASASGGTGSNTAGANVTSGGSINSSSSSSSSGIGAVTTTTTTTTTSSVAGSSRLPQSSGTGLFGRKKTRSKDTRSDKSTVTGLAAVAEEVSSERRIAKHGAVTDTRARLTAASSIPRGLAPGMGVTTRITAGSGSAADASSQPTRLLRRRPSLTGAHDKYAGNDAPGPAAQPSESTDQHRPVGLSEPIDPIANTVLGITVSEPEETTYTPISKLDYQTPTEYQTSNSRMELYMSRRLPHKLSTQNLPPPSTGYATSSSARDNSSTSSRFTETPSPFSRISTPNTAASSSSPQAVAPKTASPRTRAVVSPTKSRPPVVRRKMPGGTPVEESSSSRGLASVRENNREASAQSSSSSSNSTIKASDLIDHKTGKPTIFENSDQKLLPPAPLRNSSKRLPRPPLAEAVSFAASKLTDRSEQPVPPSVERLSGRLPVSGTKSPPSRPSRIGAPRVTSLEQADSPVIQSNLSHLATTGHTRRESMEKAISSPERGGGDSPRRRLALSPRQDSVELPSPPVQVKPRSGSKHRQIPSLTADVSKPSKRDPSPASTTSTTKSRFGLFSRRIKSPEESTSSQRVKSPEESSARKGPAAGTGHEVYGRFGRPSRGRSGSTSSNGSREKSASPSARTASKSRQGSFASNDGARPDKDNFFEQRLKPVVISGGGAIKNNRNSQSGPGASLYASSSAQSSLASIGSSVVYDRKAQVTSSESSASMISTSASDKRASRSLLPAPKLAVKQDQLAGRSLAHRRSQQRISQGEQTVRIPAPINTQVAAKKPVLDSRDTFQSSVPETGSLPTDEPAEGTWLRSGRSKGKSRMKSPRRWNIFSRNRSRSPKKSTPTSAPPSSAKDTTQVNVSVAASSKRFVGHYALMEDEDLSTDDRDIEDVLRDIENNLELRDEEGAIISGLGEEPSQPRQVSMLLPSPPKLHAEFPRLEPSPFPIPTYPPEQQYISEEAAGPTAEPEPLPLFQPASEPEIQRRPSRLQRVGRIPETVPTHRRNQISFSRPFDESDRPGLEGTQPSAQLQQSPSRPKLTLQTERLPPTTRVEQWRQATQAPAPATNAFLHNIDGEQEFMSLATERQNSQVSQSSSSGNTSFMNMLTAEIRNSQPQTDETWTESDDLPEGVDDFDLDSPEGEELLNSFPSLSNVRRTPPSISPEDMDHPRSGSKQSAGSRKSVSPPLPYKPDHLSVPPHLHPATQTHNKSNSSEISEYGRLSGRQNRLSASSSISDSRYSSRTTISSSSHVSAFVASPINQVTRAMARKTHSTRDSLRFSALMTSRWLSFDRVLFSPVAEDILTLSVQSPRILILDGLANDDWSAYTALSYPNATVYNLSTTPKLRTPSPHGDEWANPPNHKLLPLPSTAHPFPFPKGFFTAVIVRFLPLLPQHHLNNIIAEAKRVLRPGGYLEMTLLDIDPVNLGPKTRKEVKRVKMRAQQRMPDAGLAPVGDATMKLLGRRGFEGLRTAVLGVPVATSADADSIEGPGTLPFNEERASDVENANKPSRSLGDLLREAGDESGAGVDFQYPVAPTISRVARWWWSRCYEGLASVDGSDERGTLLGLRGRGEEDSRSLWADPAVVQECEERGTNLRLVLAYAVKPMIVRRRTHSA